MLSDPTTSVSDLLQLMMNGSLLPIFMDPISLYTPVMFTLAFCHMEFCTQGPQLRVVKFPLPNLSIQVNRGAVIILSQVCLLFVFTDSLPDVLFKSRSCVYMRQPGSLNTAPGFFIPISHSTSTPWVTKC